MRTVFVGVERISRWVDGFAERHGAIETAAQPQALLITGTDGATARLSLPWLPGEVPAGPGRLTAFVAHALRPRAIAVLLVRRGGHAVGLFDGTRLVQSKVGSSYVQSTTKAGGWSQQRYARRRENQATAAFAGAAEVAARVLLPRAAFVEALVRGGDRQAVETVLADPRLNVLRRLPSGPLLDVPDPKLKVLQATPERFRMVRVEVEP